MRLFLILVAPAIGAPQLALIDAAKVTGVKRFFPSEFGSDTTNDKVLGWDPQREEDYCGLSEDQKKGVDLNGLR